MKVSHKIPHGTFAKDILRYLATGIAIYIVCSSPAGTRRLLKNIKKEWKRKNTLSAMERLHRHKLISYKEKSGGNTIEVIITRAGKRKVEDWNVENLVIKKPDLWDKRWRIVTFDISEKRKKGRDALRMMLRRLGFFQLQKSVLVHPYSCRAEIEFLKELYSIPENEVLYFSTDRIPREASLKRIFKIA